MKYSIIKEDPKIFKPINIAIRLETKEDLEEFVWYARQIYGANHTNDGSFCGSHYMESFIKNIIFLEKENQTNENK